MEKHVEKLMETGSAWGYVGSESLACTRLKGRSRIEIS